MKSFILWTHIIGASASLPLVISALARQLVTHRAVPLLRKVSLSVFGVGFVSGIALLHSSPSLPKACAMLAAYTLAFALLFGMLRRKDAAASSITHPNSAA